MNDRKALVVLVPSRCCLVRPPAGLQRFRVPQRRSSSAVPRVESLFLKSRPGIQNANGRTKRLKIKELINIFFVTKIIRKERDRDKGREIDREKKRKREEDEERELERKGCVQVYVGRENDNLQGNI